MPNLFHGLSVCFGIGILFAGALPPTSQNINSSPSSADIPTVAYCELVRNSASYNDKDVRVRAIFSSDFEKSVIAAPDCSLATTWLHIPPSYKSCATRKVQEKLDAVEWGRGVDMVIVGRFESKGS